MSVEPRTIFYRMSPEEVLRSLSANSNGLSQAEAAKRLAREGAGTLDIKRKTPLWVAYLRQFKDLMIVLLLASGVISYALGDVRTAIVLILLVLFNTTIGFMQEFKAEQVMQSLAKLIVPQATTVRDGKKVMVLSPELVPGDIVYIEAGNAVPADLRVISEEELSTNDFALTGESNPSRKFSHAIEATVPLANRHNLAFMGTTVATGTALGVVIGTGMHTELGRIANLSQDIKHSDSPLQKEMNNIATLVTQGTIILCVLLLPVAIYAGLAIKDSLLFAIGIASSIIPQGLPAEINTALAQAANKLAHARALVKKLSAVEGLGATDIICTDKTGTLTKNEMTVEQLLVGRTSYQVTGTGYEPKGTITAADGKPTVPAEGSSLHLLLETGALASNANISGPDREHATWYCVGDPTEGALVTLAAKGGIKTESLNRQYPELKEFPFDSGRKRMSSLRRMGKQQDLQLFVKGAPESVLEHCTKWQDEHGKLHSLTAADRTFILQHNNDLADQAMRNLGFAYRTIGGTAASAKKLTIPQAETNLVWLGMVSMIDPIREQVPSAMNATHGAHIKVSIVTGDYAATARAIAVRAHLASSAEQLVVISGEELEKMSDKRVLELVEQGAVIFSRVAPEDKLRIVSLAQARGHVVAVTGDGINDAPALKHADIGVAMGKTGTDVAKQSADVVLLDDSFSTLVGAIREGRVIFQNIRKGALSCFTSNSAELVVNLVSLAATTFFGVPLALTVMQILAIDLVAELFPIAALGKDRGDGELMQAEPRNPKDHILNKRSILDLLWCGVMMGGFAFLNYMWFFERHNINPMHIAADTHIHFQATALTYLTIVLCQLANIMQRRSSGGFFSRYQFHNRQFWLAIALSLFCVGNIIYNPWIAPYFKAAPLSLIDWAYALSAAALFILVRELGRINTKLRTQKLQKALATS